MYAAARTVAEKRASNMPLADPFQHVPPSVVTMAYPKNSGSKPLASVMCMLYHMVVSVKYMIFPYLSPI